MLMEFVVLYGLQSENARVYGLPAAFRCYSQRFTVYFLVGPFWKASIASVTSPTTIVGHLSPDLDCLTAIWIMIRFGGVVGADLQFVPAGATLAGRPADADPRVVHVDTGGGRFDHHQPGIHTTCAAELARMVQQVCRLDNAVAAAGEQGFFGINALIAGYNMLFPNRPQHVAYAMLPNLDAWYEAETRQLRLERAFEQRREFQTPWGLGIAMESEDGGSSRLAYNRGAVLYAYRDGHGWMGVAAQSRSIVDLSPVYNDLRRVDTGADWFLHPNKRLLLCGTAKAPPRVPSRLSLDELVRVIQGKARAKTMRSN
jgi:hypothetical protein